MFYRCSLTSLSRFPSFTLLTLVSSQAFHFTGMLQMFCYKTNIFLNCSGLRNRQQESAELSSFPSED